MIAEDKDLFSFLDERTYSADCISNLWMSSIGANLLSCDLCMVARYYGCIVIILPLDSLQ